MRITPPRVLVVNADPDALQKLQLQLSRAGFDASGVSTFEEARNALDAFPPDLIVADVKLGPYNGIHLAIRCRSSYPEVHVVVTDRANDAVNESLAHDAEADYIVDPLNNPQFLPTIRRALRIVREDYFRMAGTPGKRPLEPITVHAGTFEAEIVDISDGGISLRFRNAIDLPVDFAVVLPSGESFAVTRLWTESADQGTMTCGVAPIDVGDSAWRRFFETH